MLPKPSGFHTEGRRVVENVRVASLRRALLEVGQRQLGHQVCASEITMWNGEGTNIYLPRKFFGTSDYQKKKQNRTECSVILHLIEIM